MTTLAAAFEKLTAWRLVRFAMVGAFSGGVYALAVFLLVHFAGFSAVWASTAGYIISIPTNFIGQRNYAFRSTGAHSKELGRFLVLHLVNILVSAGVMKAVAGIGGLGYMIGVACVIIIMPLSSYLVLKLLVFTDAANRHETTGPS